MKIVRRDFFSGRNIPERVQKETSVSYDDIRVRIARMVDVLGSIAAQAAINGPFKVDVRDTFLAWSALPALGLGKRDPLADVLSDLLILAEPRSGETALTINSGFCDLESGRESQIHFACESIYFGVQRDVARFVSAKLTGIQPLTLLINQRSVAL